MAVRLRSGAFLPVFLLCLLAWPAQAGRLADVPLVNADDSARLSDFRGRYVLLNLWATWCAPCVREMPGLQRLQQSRGGATFTVLPVSVEVGQTDAVRSFYGHYKLTALPLWLLESRDDKVRLKLLGLPTTILLDPQGEILWRHAGEIDWDDDRLRARLLPSP